MQISNLLQCVCVLRLSHLDFGQTQRACLLNSTVPDNVGSDAWECACALVEVKHMAFMLALMSLLLIIGLICQTCLEPRA